MKSIRLYLIVLALLLALSVYFLLSRRSGSFMPSKIEFAVQDTGSLGFVRITSPEGSVELLKTNGQWLVNGGPVRAKAIQGLTVLLSRIEVEAPASRSIESRIMKGFQERSIRVSLGMQDGREKNYLVHFDSLTGYTYLKLKDSDAAYRVSVRGYPSTNLAELYISNQRYWRDNIIFRINPAAIHGISLRNNVYPARSFHLARNEGGEFKIAGGIIPGQWSEPSRESLNQYLGYFHEVRFEMFGDPASESLYLKGEPDFIISLEKENGELQKLELFPVYHENEGSDRQLDLHRLYGRIGSMDEWIVIKYVQIDPLLQDFEYFK